MLQDIVTLEDFKFINKNTLRRVINVIQKQCGKCIQEGEGYIEQFL